MYMFNDDKEGGKPAEEQDPEEILDASPWGAVLNEPKEEEIDDDEEQLEEPNGSESVEVLRERLAARNRQIKQNRKAIQRMKQDIEELKGKTQQPALTPELIKALRGDTGNQQQDEEAREAMLEEIKENPAKILEILERNMADMENKVVQALKRRDELFESKLKAPVPQEIQNAVRVLKGLPQYKGFSDEQLEIIAKDTLPVLKKVARPPAGYSGGAAGRVTAGSPEAKNSILEKLGYGS